MAKAEKSIDINLPVRTVYDQWTQFEDFPNFMDGVKQVEQLDDKTLRWHANIGGKDEMWTARITEQIPDKRIAWQSTSGAPNSGVVTFQSLGPDKTRVSLLLEFEPRGVVETAGDKLGLVDRTVEGDLKRFKGFIESRGQETGAWRGEIKQGKVH